MKKILFVISNFNIGGPQKSLLALLDRIDYSVFSVDVLVMQPNGNLIKFINSNVNIIKPSEMVTAFTFPAGDLVKSLKIIAKKGNLIAAIYACVELLKGKVKYENVSVSRQHFWYKNHSYLPKLNEAYDAAFGILGLSTYYIIDCVNAKKKYHWIRSDSRILRHDEDIDAYYYKQCDGFLSVSYDCAEIFEKMYPFSNNLIRTFYNYIPESFYATLAANVSMMRSNDRWKILTICRLDPLKGLELAIDACRKLVDKGYDILWFVLGDGKHRIEVEKMIRDYSLENHFILLGFQYNTLAFIREADIFVHPSRTEGKSNAVDEALFCCKPTIVTNYATAKEVINDGINGVICQMSGESIAKAVEKVMLNDFFRESLIRNCLCEKETEDANEVLLQLC